MNQDQEIPEAREAANRISNSVGFAGDAFDLISQACREYAKRKNVFTTQPRMGSGV
jgi:hypothetical protein